MDDFDAFMQQRKPAPVSTATDDFDAFLAGRPKAIPLAQSAPPAPEVTPQGRKQALLGQRIAQTATGTGKFMGEQYDSASPTAAGVVGAGQGIAAALPFQPIAWGALREADFVSPEMENYLPKGVAPVETNPTGSYKWAPGMARAFGEAYLGSKGGSPGMGATGGLGQFGEIIHERAVQTGDGPRLSEGLSEVETNPWQAGRVGLGVAVGAAAPLVANRLAGAGQSAVRYMASKEALSLAANQTPEAVQEASQAISREAAKQIVKEAAGNAAFAGASAVPQTYVALKAQGIDPNTPEGRQAMASAGLFNVAMAGTPGLVNLKNAPLRYRGAIEQGVMDAGQKLAADRFASRAIPGPTSYQQGIDAPPPAAPETQPSLAYRPTLNLPPGQAPSPFSTVAPEARTAKGALPDAPDLAQGQNASPTPEVEGQWVNTPEGLRFVDRPRSTTYTTPEMEAWRQTQEMRANAMSAPARALPEPQIKIPDLRQRFMMPPPEGGGTPPPPVEPPVSGNGKRPLAALDAQPVPKPVAQTAPAATAPEIQPVQQQQPAEAPQPIKRRFGRKQQPEPVAGQGTALPGQSEPPVQPEPKAVNAEPKPEPTFDDLVKAKTDELRRQYIIGDLSLDGVNESLQRQRAELVEKAKSIYSPITGWDSGVGKFDHDSSPFRVVNGPDDYLAEREQARQVRAVADQLRVLDQSDKALRDTDVYQASGFKGERFGARKQQKSASEAMSRATEYRKEKHRQELDAMAEEAARLDRTLRNAAKTRLEAGEDKQSIISDLQPAMDDLKKFANYMQRDAWSAITKTGGVVNPNNYQGRFKPVPAELLAKAREKAQGLPDAPPPQQPTTVQPVPKRKFGKKAQAQPVAETPPQSPADRLRAAYPAVKTAAGFSDVPIADLAKAAGVTPQEAGAALAEMQRGGEAVLSRGDESVATPEQQAAGVEVLGRKNYQVRLNDANRTEAEGGAQQRQAESAKEQVVSTDNTTAGEVMQNEGQGQEGRQGLLNQEATGAGKPAPEAASPFWSKAEKTGNPNLRFLSDAQVKKIAGNDVQSGFSDGGVTLEKMESGRWAVRLESAAQEPPKAKRRFGQKKSQGGGEQVVYANPLDISAAMEGLSQLGDLANKAVRAAGRPVGRFIGKAARKAAEAVPDAIKKPIEQMLSEPLSQTPELKGIKKMMDERIQTGYRDREAALRLMLPDAATKEQRLAMDRIMRGHPTDIDDLPEEFLKKAGVSKALIQQMAQEMSVNMKNLGLSVREEWIDGEKHWYPNLFQKHELRGVMGRLFAPQGQRVGLSASEAGHAKQRLSDRFVVINSKTGKPVQVRESAVRGGYDMSLEHSAAFDTLEEAEAFVRNQGKYYVDYSARDEGGRKKNAREYFDTRKEAMAFVNSMGEDGSVRVDDEMSIRWMGKEDSLAILHPMTPEQMRAHGLIENIVTNMRRGFGSAQNMVAKTQFFDEVSRYLKTEPKLYSQDPQDGFVPVKDLELRIPKAIDNADIQDFLRGNVSEDLARDLKYFFGSQGWLWRLSEVLKAPDRFLGLRNWVTYRNPFRHAKQFIENELMMFMVDSTVAADLPARGEALSDMWKWVRDPESSELGPYLREFVNSDLLESDYLSNEEVKAMVGRIGSDANVDRFHAEVMNWFDTMKEKLGTSKIGLAASRIDRFLRDVYHLEDAALKYQLYHVWRKRGATADQARERVLKQTFDWSNAPRVVKWASFIPFMASVGWQYARVITNTIAQSPATHLPKLALLLAAMAMLRDSTDREAGITDEDRSGNNPKMSPAEFALPVTDSQGRRLTFNASWLLPYNDIAMIDPSWKGVRSMGRKVLPMWMQAPATLALQQDRYGNPLVFDNTKDPEKKSAQTARVLKETAKAALPGMAGSYEIDMLSNAMADPEKKRDWWDQALTKQFGATADMPRSSDKKPESTKSRFGLKRGNNSRRFGRR